MKIISPAQFKTTRWKNGNGETTELAVSRQCESGDFDWRLSKAVVAEHGEFSDFSGYQRHLMLLDGAGMLLQHDGGKIDHLRTPMDFSVFSGCSHTVAHLYGGAIADFNLITREDKYAVDFRTFSSGISVELVPATVSFIYSMHGTTKITDPSDNTSTELPEDHLLIIDKQSNDAMIVTGQQILLIGLTEITTAQI